MPHRFPSHSGSPSDSVVALHLSASGLEACHCHVQPRGEEHDILSSSRDAIRDCIGLHLTPGYTSWGCIQSKVACHGDPRSHNPCAWMPSAPCWISHLCPSLWLSWDHRAAIYSTACSSIHHPFPIVWPSTHSLVHELVLATGPDGRQSQGCEERQVLLHQGDEVLLHHVELRRCPQWSLPILPCLPSRAAEWMSWHILEGDPCEGAQRAVWCIAHAPSTPTNLQKRKPLHAYAGPHRFASPLLPLDLECPTSLWRPTTWSVSNWICFDVLPMATSHSRDVQRSGER